MEFKPANHSHWCPKCQGHKYCPQITHCKRPDIAVCWDCQPTESLTVERAEERKGESK